MSLKRTSSALHSLHRFFRVDMIVFCEGGDALSYESAVGNAPGSPTLDTFFWSRLVETLGLNKSFHFKSVGAKSITTEIAQEVQSLGVTTISVCMDSDYDGCLGLLRKFPRACYSTGYSWENDVLNELVVEQIVTDFIGNGINEAAKTREYMDKLDLLRIELVKWTEIDISLRRLGKKSIFNRTKPASSLDFTNIPSLREDELRRRLNEIGYVRRPKRAVNLAAHQCLKICFGKLVSHAVYQAVGKIFDFFDVRRLSYDQFMRLAITKTTGNLNHTSHALLASNFRAQAHCFA